MRQNIRPIWVKSLNRYKFKIFCLLRFIKVTLFYKTELFNFFSIHLLTFLSWTLDSERLVRDANLCHRQSIGII